MAGKPFLELFHLLFIKGAGISSLLFLPDKGNPLYRSAEPIVWLRNKIFNLLLPLGDHRQRGRLYPSAGKLGVIFTGQRSGRIDSHQPIRLRPAHGRIIEGFIFLAAL